MRLSQLLVIFLIGAGFAAVWLYDRDPLVEFPPEHGLHDEQQPLPAQEPHRRLEHVVLHTTRLGDIGIAINLPDPLPAGKLPLVIVLGGLGTGENNIRYVTGAGNNAVIGYDWPMPPRFYGGLQFVTQMPELYNRLMSIPGQAVSAIDWLELQPWADTQRVSILGFSLGALATPVIQDVAQQDQLSIGWTILAYGGAPFGELFAANPHFKPAILRMLLAPVIDLLLQPLEPTQHLPHLSGHFLVLEGQNDALIPAAARANLRDAVPEPKTVITFEGNHMGVGQEKMALLHKIIDTSKRWLFENGAVNPP